MRLNPPSTKPHQDLVMTPRRLAHCIVEHFNPMGFICEPCYGDGAFFDAIYGRMQTTLCAGYEISEGTDFLKEREDEMKFEWIVTNPPWSKDLFNAFLAKSMKVADNVVFLVAMNKLMTRLRMEMIDKAGFGFKEILRVDRPSSWPSSGFEYAAIHLKRYYNGGCKFSKLA